MVGWLVGWLVGLVDWFYLFLHRANGNTGGSGSSPPFGFRRPTPPPRATPRAAPLLGLPVDRSGLAVFDFSTENEHVSEPHSQTTCRKQPAHRELPASTEILPNTNLWRELISIYKFLLLLFRFSRSHARSHARSLATPRLRLGKLALCLLSFT